MRARHSPRPGLIAFAAALLTGLSLSLAEAYATPAPPPPAPPPFDSLLLRTVTFGTPRCAGCPPVVCAGEPVPVRLSGLIPPCVAFRGVRELPVAGLVPVFEADFVADTCSRSCDGPLVEWSGSLELPPQASGPHVLVLRVATRVCPDTTVIAGVAEHHLPFEVLAFCPPPPPPPVPVDSLVRTFASFRILPERRCPGDSLVLEWAERGCPPCVTLEGLTLTRVRGWVGSMSWRPACFELVCHSDTLRLGLGRFAAGMYELRVNTDVHVLDTANPDSMIRFESLVRFAVTPTCGTDQGCLWPSMPPGPPQAGCALTVRPGGSGDILLPVRNDLHDVHVAGVQGWVVTSAPFHVVDILPARPGPGVHLSWHQDGELSRFLIFDLDGNLIPPGVTDLLRVALAADSVEGPYPVTSSIRGEIEVTSDPEGREVPLCPVPLIALAGLRLCIDTTATTCDANGDGREDVRDLVLMTRCLRHVLAPPDSARLCHDCDHDGVFALEDILCCAREILRGPGVPSDSVHAAADVHVSFDPIESDGEARVVRVRLSGVRALSGAMLRLRFPADRWHVEDPAARGVPSGPAGNSNWLPLMDSTRPGLLVLAGIRLADDAGEELVFETRLTPLAPAANGDAISVEAADLAASDGQVLTPATGLPSAQLRAPDTAPVAIALSLARPNPFTSSTGFTVSLPRSAAVEVSVHDVAGRRVATLMDGVWPAGAHDIEWRGAGLPDGLYFVRLTVEGRVLSSRVVLLRDSR